MDRLIEDFEVQLVEPGCAPGATRWNALATFSNDISDVFPYLNALFDGVWYDHENKTLIWREDTQTYAFRPNEIRIAQVQDPEHARQAVSELVDRLNRIWQERDGTEPRYTERKRPPVIDILKLLPQTNCRQCGYATCMAYAADLSQGKTELEDCPPLSLPEHAGRKEKIAELFARA
jgi:ArsR family metal-binding transcriptional regulator